MASLFIFFVFLNTCFLQEHVGAICLLLKNCTLQLEDLINHTHVSGDISTMIPLCLNVVDKQSDLQTCETNAVVTCSLGGFEPDYSYYTKKKIQAKKKCLKDCPEMNAIKICQGEIKYDVIQKAGYSQFCSHYNSVQMQCVKTKLRSCSFTNQLFESGLSEDGKRIVQTICKSGCSSINKTMERIDTCNKQLSVTSGYRNFSDCRFYEEYINCIKEQPSCPEFRKVAQYTLPRLSEAQVKCEPSTTTSSTARISTTYVSVKSTKPTSRITENDSRTNSENGNMQNDRTTIVLEDIEASLSTHLEDKVKSTKPTSRITENDSRRNSENGNMQNGRTTIVLEDIEASLSTHLEDKVTTDYIPDGYTKILDGISSDIYRVITSQRITGITDSQTKHLVRNAHHSSGSKTEDHHRLVFIIFLSWSIA